MIRAVISVAILGAASVVSAAARDATTQGEIATEGFATTIDYFREANFR